MMERYYRFAGLEFAVKMPEEMMYADAYRLTPFAVDAVTDPHIYQFERVEVLHAPAGDCIYRDPGFRVYRDADQEVRYLGTVEMSWESAYARVAHSAKTHMVQVRGKDYPGRLGTKVVLDAMAIEHYIARNGGFVFHCAYIDRNGQAILFTAPSETGKSTQADLWKQYRGTDIINGDRAAVRVAEGAVLAEGIPFSGSSPYCENCSLPLEAIVYLGQAPVTSVRRLRGYEAFARIWEGVSVNTWDKKDLELASETVKTIAESVPVFHMPCTPDEAAVTALERELNKLVTL